MAENSNMPLTSAALTELDTLVKQNGALTESLTTANEFLVSLLGEEYSTAKQSLAAMIVSLGGVATADMSLAQLTQAVYGLQAVFTTRVTVGTFSLPNDSSFTIANISWLAKTLETSWSNKFQNFRQLTIFTTGGLYIDTSSVTTMGSMFSGCSALQSVNLQGLDTSSVTNMTAMFANCTALTSLNMQGMYISFNYNMFGNTTLSNLRAINFLDTKVSSIAKQNPTTFTDQCFYKCVNMEDFVNGMSYEEVVAQDIKIWDGFGCDWEATQPGKTATNWQFLHAYNSMPYLNRASLRAILNGLCDRTGQTAYTIEIGSTLRNKLSDEDIAVATAKNWTLA